ncbi:hypothetical protein BRE01_48690 [Brevibacillus reuszeri]|uniref:Uncharacterized protein n=1 Tax=Brevibacillus reuszeri TaxID=54915 RepID=A0ABQ0TTB2_9BACL|nr:hypothetical protein [Brevibacillus reuszeri]MED1861603.1 hypothetical protein [Brevibacillus reuszeri]GED71167.1 hypothetical protein BRE01_48690 [Brevibacillus reuszeri]
MGDIRSIAIYEAQTQGVDVNIVLATIEAETNFTNKTGDQGRSLGPGQVQPRWHNDDFVWAANRFRLNWPSTLQEQTNLVLSNDQFAVAVAVRVIGKTWRASKQNFREFSLIYVGKKIPDSDYLRRLKIYQKYAGGGAGGSWTPSASAPSGAIGGLGGGGQSANLINDITLPSTNYGIVANSQKAGNVLYGRRYRVLISNGKSTALDVSDLRCVFDIKKTLTPQPNFSTVTIYNLNTETENQVINEGDTVIVEAGYEGEQYGLIFRGDVIQAIRGKEDGVDYKLILNSVDGDRFFNNGMVNISVAKGQTARSQIGIVTSQAKVPTQQGTISNYLQPAALTRGKVFFGLGKDYLRQIAQSNAATFYLEDGKVNIITAQDYPPNEIVDLAPESGLIGTPMQTDFGVSFKCLLNPRLKINSLVRIDNSQIQAQTFQFGQIQRGLDAAGIYRIIGIRQNGDTRGDAWYTECDTVSQAGGVIPSLMPSGGANIWR